VHFGRQTLPLVPYCTQMPGDEGSSGPSQKWSDVESLSFGQVGRMQTGVG